MKPLSQNIVVFLTLLCLFFIAGCSSEKNTWTNKAFHNTTAHYNAYYYAREEIAKVEQTIWASLEDDYNRILKLYPSTDTALAKGYDKEIQEVIKMASLAIQRHPNSKWVDDSYILVGKARLYSLDWGNDIQTFKYVNTKSKDPDARHQALIHLIRTFTEHQEFNNAQAAIDFLQKEKKLSKANKKNLLLEKAHFYQTQNNYDYMVRSLSEADAYLEKKDRPGRIYFIIGQVYQKLGFESEAYNYYKKCLSTNPEYEVDFYARLYMAQVTEISRGRDVNAARKSFKKLLKDGKNKEFKDKIFYEMGVFELKQKNLNEAITNFNYSLREGNNERIDGEAYLRLGEIYYDTLRNYELSQAYYDSAINALPQDYEGYQAIKTRSEILNEFVKHLKTIKVQDSLLAMVSLDSATLYAKVKTAYDAKALEAEKAKKKKGAKRIDIDSNLNNVFATGNEPQGTSEGSGGWYFSNPSTVAIGQTEFKRIWGEILLQDNWRRSQRIGDRGVTTQNSINNNEVKPEEVTTTEPTAEPADPVAAEYQQLRAQLPNTPEKVKEAHAKIEEAYFFLGDIYYFKLEEKHNAVVYYKKLLERFPETDYEPEVLYKLYLIHKDSDPSAAEQFASILKTKYPNSTFTKVLINPNYLAESGQTVEKQKAIYKEAYQLFEEEEYKKAIHKIEEAFALGESTFMPNLELFKILIVGKREDITLYQYELDNFIKKYPETEVGKYAQILLNASREFQKELEKRKGIKYSPSLAELHYFILIYKKKENIGNAASSTLEEFNNNFYSALKLNTSNLIFNDDYIITMVSDLPGVSSAIEYGRTFNEKLPTFPRLRNHKFNNFVITKSNFDIFYRTKGLDEYLRFFEKNYPTEE